MRSDTRILICAILILVVIAMPVVIAAEIPTEPEGPSTLSVVNSTRRTPASAATIDAQAGNVTELSIYGSTVTQTWQAYYGNITGTITLDDALNHTIYDWQVTIPKGEIFASEGPIDFAYGNVQCYDFNMTDVGYSDFNTLSEYETILGLDASSADGIDETFEESTNYTTFYVGSKLINDICPKTNPYDQNETKDPNKFQELLLYDNTSNKIVYTSILEQDALGFDGRYWDFEMIVGENGHDGEAGTTQFYFYVEIE